MGAWADTLAPGAAAGHALRILYVVGPASGGILQHVGLLLRGLDRNRYLPAVACPAGHELGSLAGELGLPMHDLRLGAAPWHEAGAAVALSRLAARHGYHLLHTHSFTAGMAGCLAAALSPRVPTVCTVHNFLAPGGRRRRRLERLGIALMRAQASRIITVSQALAALFGECEKVQVIYNGLPGVTPIPREEARRALGVPAEGPVVGMVARLAPEKGVLQFMRVAARIAAARSDVHFALVGEGPLLEQVQHLAEQAKIAGRLSLPGRVENAGRLFFGMDVALVPSVWEGASITAVEALAAGCPVIANRTCGLPEMLDQGRAGVLVDPGDDEAMAAQALALLADPGRREELALAGLDWARRFSASAMIEQTEGVYSSLFSGARL